jgi:hypothetical protein
MDEIATQLTLEFEPHLTERFRSLKQCVATCIYRQRGGIGAVAGRLDMSPSHLSEVLGGGGDRHRKFDLDELERYIETYHDFEPILYLCAKFLGDKHAEQSAAIKRLSETLTDMAELMAKAGVAGKRRKP